MAEKRLIDLDKVKPMDFPSCEMDGLDVVQYLNTLPTVDAVEVVHGRWEIYREPEWPEWAMRLMCSACGLKTSQKSQYCPNCGARMDKEAPHE